MEYYSQLCNTEASKAVLYFYPKRVFGQFLLRKAVIEVDGLTETGKIKKYKRLDVHCGNQEVQVYGKYFGKMGLSSCTYNFEAGKTYEIVWKSPALIFMKGKLKISVVSDEKKLKKLAAKAKK